MSDLLPCPFCGASDLEKPEKDAGLFVSCNSCGTYGPDSDTKKGAILDWNTRHTPPVQWVHASDRLPTAEDGDCEEMVWVLSRRPTAILRVKWCTFDHTNVEAWARTGITKPTPPTV